MRKLLLLICALLTGVSGAWATDGSVTITSSSALWSANGTFSNTSGDNAGSWRSTNGIISFLCLNGGKNILSYATKSRLQNSNNFLIVANGDNHITGFSIKFKAYNEDGTNRNSSITFHDSVSVTSTNSAEVTKSFSGLNAQVIKFTTGNNWVDIIDFSVSYAEGSDNTLCSTTPINTFNDQASVGWLKVLTPSDYVFYTMSSLRMNLRTDNVSNYDVYLVVSDHIVGSGTTSGLSESNFTAISSNSSGTSSTDVTFNFTNPVTLRGGSYYYLYFATKTDDTYTLSLRGVKVKTNSNSLGVGGSITATNIYNNSQTWSIPFTATLTPVTSNLKCRLKAKWPNTNTSNQHYTNYVFAKTDNLNKLYKNNKTKLSAADMINAKMVWNVTYSGSGLKLQNVGTERYISKFSSDKSNGDAINLLTADNSTNAETLKIQEYNTQGQGYIALVSGNQLSVNNKISFLESFSSSNEYVGCHNNYDAGDAFIFERVKTVTFVDGEDAAFNVDVNGNSVSTIYVATDGSDASKVSLPSDKLYSFDDGETWLSNTAAAANITEAGTSDISVTVAPAVSVTYNLIWDNPSTPIQTEASVNAPQGYSPSVTVPWNAPAFCEFSYDVATIGESTTTVNVALNWAGPFDISSDFENANWCYLKMHGQYLIYSGSTSYFLGDLAAAEAAGYNAFWAFVGDPVNGFQLINKAAGSDKNLVVAWFPNMGTANTKWFLQQWNDDFALRTNTYLYLNNADGQLKLWVSGQSEEETDFDCKIESASYRGLALAFIDDYADSHAVGHYFGVATSTYNSVRAGYADAASVSASDYTQLVSFIGGMLPASYPETGYYRIKSNSGRYIGYGQPEADPMPSVGLRTVSAEDAAKDASTIIHLVKGVGSHQYTMSTQGKNVQSMVNGNTPFPATSDAGVTFVLEALTTTPGKGTIRNTASNNEDNGYINGYLHEANWTVPGVINWEAGSESSQWSIEDVTSIDVTLRDGGDGYYYTTAYFDFPVSYTGASNGEGLFVLTGESNGKATAQKVTSVPKTQGFLIRIAAKNVTDSKVTLTIPASADALAGDNILTGTCLATTKPDGKVYVFSKVGDDLGFFPYTGSDIPANRAYIVEPAGSGTRSFILSFDDTTGINGVSTSMPAGTIFDMQGRRVNKAEKGLYIVNGKKVLF